MANKALKKRDEIPEKYKWNIETMYSNLEDWEKDYSLSLKSAETYTEAFQGNLSKDSNTLFQAFTQRDTIWQLAEKVYVFARMKRDEDNSNSTFQALADRCHTMISSISAAMSFFTPELLKIPTDTLLGFIQENDNLKLYEHIILNILREKEHVLSAPEENILAQISEITSSTNDIFTMLNNADMKFGNIIDEYGEEVEVTHGKYISFMESKDREVRKSAYEKMYEAYKKQINTLATTYNYNTKTDVVVSRIRKYESALDAALSGDNISKDVYTNLIDTVNKNLPTLHKYIALRKKILGVDELKMYDVYTPLVHVPKKDIPYETALEIIEKALEILGTEYVSEMKKGISDRWIDVYENEGKTSGAYSFGSYDSMPFIMLNYDGKLQDVFTLIHEMGHSMHSYYTRKTQPFIYGGHSIFTAEVASTVNEALLINYLLKKETDSDMRKYLINMQIEGFRTTLFRQTMFAEFELLTHEAVENGQVLTAEWLCTTYDSLNKKYFGDSLGEDEYIKYEWARIPHFYRSFYVYQYATGYSAATAISAKILNEGEAAVKNYIEFLKSGDSNYPVELLKIAGVDMSSPKSVEEAMSVFRNLVDEFEGLV